MKTYKEKNEVALLKEMFRLSSVGDILQKINNSGSGTDADPDIYPFIRCALGFDPKETVDYWLDRFCEVQEMYKDWGEMAQQYYDDLKKWAIDKNRYQPKRMIKTAISDAMIHHLLTVPFHNHLKAFTVEKDEIRFEYGFYGCGQAYDLMGFPMDGEFDSDEEIVMILDKIFDQYVASKTMEDVNKLGGSYQCAEEIYKKWMIAIDKFEWVENKELSTA